MPRYRRAALIDEVATAGLRGRGGAAFPTAVKLRGGRRAPRAPRDRRQRRGGRAAERQGPHAARACAAPGARRRAARPPRRSAPREIVVGDDALRCRGERRGRAGALASGATRTRCASQIVPDAYLAGEETALIAILNGGPLKPTLDAAAAVRARPRPAPDARLERRDARARGADRPPRRAMVPRARHGGSPRLRARDGRRRGRAPGRVRDRPRHAARARARDGRRAGAGAGAVLVGGYYGAWLAPAPRPARASTTARCASTAPRSARASSSRCRSEACPVAEVARVRRLDGGESAGQCGPCVHGLAAIAGALASLADGRPRPRRARPPGALERPGRRAAARAITPTAWCASCAARSPCSPSTSRTTSATVRATLRRAAACSIPEPAGARHEPAT